MAEKKAVYEAICNIVDELSKEGISKDRKNKEQNWNYRSIDDIYHSLAPLLAKHKLCILPEVIDRKCEERISVNNKTVYSVTVEVNYSLISVIDSSSTSCKVFGEAMDFSDKATNKALSAAYKYMCIQTFCIPTEGENDADATSIETIGKVVPSETTGKVVHLINKAELSILNSQLDILDKSENDFIIWLKNKGINVDELSLLEKQHFNFVTQQLDHWIKHKEIKNAN